MYLLQNLMFLEIDKKKSDKPVEMDYVSFDTLNNEIENQLLKS